MRANDTRAAAKQLRIDEARRVSRDPNVSPLERLAALARLNLLLGIRSRR